MKSDVDSTGKLLANLQGIKITGSTWQQKAIDHVSPLLKEMADNLQSVIKRLNRNQPGLPVFKQYASANYDVAADLEMLIRTYLDYRNAKEKFEKIGSKLTVG